MMEIEQKYRIIWKNEFEKNDKTTHLNRYLFLLELFNISVKQKDYINYDKYRDVSEYFDFSKKKFFVATDYDTSFLFSQKHDRKHTKELVQSYLKNIHHPKKVLANKIWFIGLMGILSSIYGCLYFLQFSNAYIKKSSFYSLITAGTLFVCYIIFKLYLKGKFPFIFLTKELFMRPPAFIENLEYEKQIIETIFANYSELTQLESFNIFCSHLPEARIYFEVLIDNDYIEIKNKTIKYNSPCTQKVFAEILKDPLFVFNHKLSQIPTKVFKDLFGKTLNQMEQREQKTAESENYKKVKAVLINSNVPMFKEYL